MRRSLGHSLLLLAVALGCGRGGAPTPEVPAVRTLSSYSVYDLGSTWRDQGGAQRTLASLRGKPRLVAMIYTKCTSVCPLSIGELKRIEAATDGRLGLVLVTLDPEHDTPTLLAQYAKEHDMSAERWTLLTGTDDDLRDLAATLAVRYRRVSPDDLAHSNTLTLLDAEGRVVRQQAGLADGALLAEARTLLR